MRDRYQRAQKGAGVEFKGKKQGTYTMAQTGSTSAGRTLEETSERESACAFALPFMVPQVEPKQSTPLSLRKGGKQELDNRQHRNIG